MCPISSIDNKLGEISSACNIGRLTVYLLQTPLSKKKQYFPLQTNIPRGDRALAAFKSEGENILSRNRVTADACFFVFLHLPADVSSWERFGEERAKLMFQEKCCARIIFPRALEKFCFVPR